MLLSDKSWITGFRQQRSGCVYYYPGIASRVEVPGTPYRMSGTLEFSCIAYQERASDAFADSWASIAFPRRPLSERAQWVSLGRRGNNRRRSEWSTKFHRICGSVGPPRNFGPFRAIPLNCNMLNNVVFCHHSCGFKLFWKLYNVAGFSRSVFSCPEALTQF